MNQMMEKMKKKCNLPFTIYVVYLVVLHLLMTENADMDGKRHFAQVLKQSSMYEFLKSNYEQWSSRMAIDASCALVAQSTLLWSILDILLLLLLAWSISKIFGRTSDTTFHWLIVGMLMLFPLDIMSSAGWIATTMNYLWPAALGMFSFVAIAKTYRKEEIRKIEWVLYVLAAVYASNMEQMCAVMAVLVGAALFYFLWERKIVVKGILAEFFVIAANLLLILECPGNYARLSVEIGQGVRNFHLLTLTDKVYTGFYTTMKELMEGNLLLLVFFIFLAFLIWKESKNIAYRMISLVPVLLMLGQTEIGFYTGHYGLAVTSDASLNSVNYMSKGSYYVFGIMCLFLLCFLIEIAILSYSYTEWIFLSLVACMGVASRVVLGFSPTLYLSEERTFTYLYFAFLFVCIYFMHRKAEIWEKDKNSNKYTVIFGAVAMMNAVNMLAYAANAV